MKKKPGRKKLETTPEIREKQVERLREVINDLRQEYPKDTQTELARLVAYDRSLSEKSVEGYLSAMLNGKQSVSPDYAESICFAYNKSLGLIDDQGRTNVYAVRPEWLTGKDDCKTKFDYVLRLSGESLKEEHFKINKSFADVLAEGAKELSKLESDPQVDVYDCMASIDSSGGQVMTLRGYKKDDRRTEIRSYTPVSLTVSFSREETQRMVERLKLQAAIIVKDCLENKDLTSWEKGEGVLYPISIEEAEEITIEEQKQEEENHGNH